jgi:hypothetical protein
LLILFFKRGMLVLLLLLASVAVSQDASAPVIEAAVAAAVAGGPAEDASGDAAVAELKRRLTFLADAANACRDDKCLAPILIQRKALRREARLLARIEKCVADFQDSVLRAKCLAEDRKVLLEMLGSTVAPVPSAEATVAPEVQKAVLSEVDAGKSGSPNESIKAEEAIKALVARVNSVKAEYAKCDELKDDAQKRGCRETLDQQKDVYAREEELVRKVDQCARDFSSDEAKRINCVTDVSRELIPLVRPVPASLRPRNARRGGQGRGNARLRLGGSLDPVGQRPRSLHGSCLP